MMIIMIMMMMATTTTTMMMMLMIVTRRVYSITVIYVLNHYNKYAVQFLHNDTQLRTYKYSKKTHYTNMHEYISRMFMCPSVQDFACPST